METEDTVFNIEEMYQNYLKLIGQREETMHPEQKVQVKNAFMGGLSSMLAAMLSMEKNLSEEIAVLGLQSLLDQCDEFWVNQMVENGIKRAEVPKPNTKDKNIN